MVSLGENIGGEAYVQCGYCNERWYYSGDRETIPKSRAKRAAKEHEEDCPNNV
jgi:hypothetical protein